MQNKYLAMTPPMGWNSWNTFTWNINEDLVCGAADALCASEKVKEQLQSNWSEAITQRTYVAVIEGRPEKDTDLIVSNLVENKHMQVYVTQDGDGKEAITRYRLLQTNNRYSLVELDMETGRKNQIRAQMQSIGHPIAGDSKYGAETNPAGRLMLHARRLCFIHPVTGEEMRFETRIPEKFTSTAK